MDFKNDPWHLIMSGDYQRAIELYTRKFDQSGDGFFLHNRGLAFLLSGNFISALNDFDTVITLEKKGSQSQSDFLYIGICYWYLHQPHKSVQIWQESMSMPYTDAAGGVEPIGLLYYASARTHDRSLMENVYNQLKIIWKNDDDSSSLAENTTTRHDRFSHANIHLWPGPIIPYLLGFINPQEFMNSIMTTKNEILIARRKCQANFYIGIKAYFENEHRTFQESMRQCNENKLGLLEHEFYLGRWEVENKFPELT